MSRYIEIERNGKVYTCEWRSFLHEIPASFYEPPIDAELVDFRVIGPNGETLPLDIEEQFYTKCLESALKRES